MKVRIKKLNNYAQLPKYNKSTDAGMDLISTSKNRTDDYIEYGTGLAIEIPEGYVGLLFPRSSISQTQLALTNSVGVIDSGYRGEIKFRFRKTPHQTASSHDVITLGQEYELSEKIGQLIIIPYPKIEFEEVEELNESDRGTNGFGSSGR